MDASLPIVIQTETVIGIINDIDDESSTAIVDRIENGNKSVFVSAISDTEEFYMSYQGKHKDSASSTASTLYTFRCVKKTVTLIARTDGTYTWVITNNEETA